MIALTDEFTGAIVSGADESYAYGPFGPSDEVSGAGNPYRFTGRRLDDETGFYHYRARVYSVALGRFLQPDPAGFADGLNLYAYVANDPMNFIDPMGLGSALKVLPQIALGRDGFFTGVGRGLLQSGYDLFIANDAGPYMTGLGILWGAEPGPIFPPPSSLAESIGRVTGSVGSAVAGGAAIGLSATRGAREAGNAISQVSSPLKKALLTGFHSTAKHNATKAVSPSSETMRTI